MIGNLIVGLGVTLHQERAKIGERLADIGDHRRGVGLNADQLPDLVWCEVPGGKVTLEEGAGIFDVESGYISQYPVTWAQYRCFLQAEDGYANTAWWEGLAAREEGPGEQYRELDNHPADMVSWYDAVAYCRWLSAKLGYEIRLPTEWEWQQAATGGNPAYEYSWGADWDADRANTYESRLGLPTAVGMYPHGASPVGGKIFLQELVHVEQLLAPDVFVQNAECDTGVDNVPRPLVSWAQILVRGGVA